MLVKPFKRLSSCVGLMKIVIFTKRNKCSAFRRPRWSNQSNDLRENKTKRNLFKYVCRSKSLKQSYKVPKNNNQMTTNEWIYNL